MSLFYFQIEKTMVRVKHILQFSYYIWIYIQFHEKNMYFRSSVNYTVRKVLYKVFVTLRKCHDIGKNNERNFSLLGSKLLGRGQIIIISIGGCKMQVCTYYIHLVLRLRVFCFLRKTA